MRRYSCLFLVLFLFSALPGFAEPNMEVVGGRGSIQASKRVLVSSRVHGRVAEVVVEEGTRVKAGQVLARLDPEMAQQACKVAEAKVKRAEVRVRGAEGGNAQEQALARAELEVAQAELAQTRAAVEAHVVLAPFDGFVLRVNVEVGGFTNPQLAGLTTSSSICELADLSKLYVDAAIAEHQVTRLSPGLPCEVRLQSNPNRTFAGVVERVSRVVNGGNVNVRVKLNAPPADALLDATVLVRMMP